MNKKIKIIEIYNKVANNKDLPKQIIWEGMIWTLDEGRDYISETNRTLGSDVRLDELNEYVEILEDNTGVIEELSTYREIEGFGELDKRCINQNTEEFFDKINELVKAVNKMKEGKE